MNQQEIADLIGISQSAISRELKRNTGKHKTSAMSTINTPGTHQEWYIFFTFFLCHIGQGTSPIEAWALWVACMDAGKGR